VARNLRIGSRGNDVLEVQTLLQKWGYSPGPLDGIFGYRTQQAVLRFQRDQGLVADGIVGPKTLQALRAKPPVPISRSVAGWLPYWLQASGFASVQANSEVFDQLSPFWYRLESSGAVGKFPFAEDPGIIEFARNKGIHLIPLISNEFNQELISNMINNLALRTQHIQNLVNLVQSQNYDGIDLNYENLPREDRDVFAAFVQEISVAFRTIQKRLVVTVHGKTTDEGDWYGAAAHDYQAIGQAADLVRVMAYDYSWSTSPPGPIAPAVWVDQVLAYAASKIPLTKIVLGVPTYGYDWAEAKGQGVTYKRAMSIAEQHGVTIIQDPLNGPHYSYTANNVNHEVWFTDALSTGSLLDLVNRYNIYGIVFWHLGDEDPNIYPVIKSKFV
jgi:spore germination protein YaaH